MFSPIAKTSSYRRKKQRIGKREIEVVVMISTKLIAPFPAITPIRSGVDRHSI